MHNTKASFHRGCLSLLGVITKGILGLLERPPLCQEVAGKPVLRPLLQGIPSALSLGSVCFDFAKKGSGDLTHPTVSLRSRSWQAPHCCLRRCPMQRGPGLWQRCIASICPGGADPASPGPPAAALLQNREPHTLGTAGCSGEVFSCLCGGFLEEGRLWPPRDSDEKQPSTEKWEWALRETHSDSRDCESEGSEALISDGSQQESRVVFLFVSIKTQFQV